MSRGGHCRLRGARPAKNRAAVQLGRMGGKMSAKNHTPEQRSETARNAAKARWAKPKPAVESAPAKTKIAS